MSILKQLDSICSVVECGRDAYAKGFCPKHYDRMRRNGTLETLHRRGSDHHNWRGGTRSDRGRVSIYRPDHPCANSVGYVYRYRLVMEEKIGRLLAPNEVVHHKDGDEANDDPSNLELITQSVHATIHNETRTRNEKGQFTT